MMWVVEMSLTYTQWMIFSNSVVIKSLKNEFQSYIAYTLVALTTLVSVTEVIKNAYHEWALPINFVLLIVERVVRIGKVMVYWHL